MRQHLQVGVLSFFVLPLLLIVPKLSAQDDIFVTPVPNAPFSGVINVERSIVHKDGSAATLKTVRAIHRDVRGRIYNEYRTLQPASTNDPPQITHVLIYDPQTRTSTTLFPPQHLYRSSTTRRPPPPLLPCLPPVDREMNLRVKKIWEFKTCREWLSAVFVTPRPFLPAPPVRIKMS